MKICPYNRAREVQHYEQYNKPNEEDGQSPGYKYDMYAEFYPAPCFEEQCGAWHDGRCCYASANLENS